MKIYVVTDLEGVSGVVEFEDRQDASPTNLALRQKYARLLTGEVNAAVAAAFAAGATEVLVDDAHGSGYTIDFEALDPRAQVLHGRCRTRDPLAALDESFDGLLAVGLHAQASTQGGVLYHTWSCATREFRLNGRPVGEIGIFAFVAGAYGVPTLFVSGDTAACREAEALIPNITTVAVKTGLSRFAAIAWPPQKSRQMIGAGVKRALRQRKQVKPFVLKPPFSFQADVYAEKSYASHPADLPQKWQSNDAIQAKSARELIQKVWGNKV